MCPGVAKCSNLAFAVRDLPACSLVLVPYATDIVKNAKASKSYTYSAKCSVKVHRGGKTDTDEFYMCANDQIAGKASKMRGSEVDCHAVNPFWWLMSCDETSGGHHAQIYTV